MSAQVSRFDRISPAAEPNSRVACSHLPIGDLISLYEKLSGWRLSVIIDHGRGVLVKSDHDDPLGDCPSWLSAFINDNVKVVADHIRDTRGYLVFRPDCSAEFIPRSDAALPNAA